MELGFLLSGFGGEGVVDVWTEKTSELGVCLNLTLHTVPWIAHFANWKYENVFLSPG